MSLDTMRMRYFIAIAKSGSLTRAASELHVAQSALSVHLRSLEEELDTQLFDRTPRGVCLTGAGEILFAHCLSIMRAVEQAEHETREHNTHPSGEVLLGIIFSLFPTLGMAVMEKCKQRFPLIKLTICEGDSKSLKNSIDNQIHDLVVMPQEIANRTALELFEESMYVIGPAGYFPSNNAIINLADIIELPLILPPRQHGIWQTLNMIFDADQRQPNIVWEIEGLSATKHAIRKGLGFSILTKSAISDDTGHLSYAKIANPEVKRVMVLDMATTHPATRAMQEVHKLVLQVVRESETEGHWQCIHSA